MFTEQKQGREHFILHLNLREVIANIAMNIVTMKIQRARKTLLTVSKLLKNVFYRPLSDKCTYGFVSKDFYGITIS